MLRTRREAISRKKYLNEQGFRILDALDQVARRLHAKPAQVALPWLMARLTVTAPIQRNKPAAVKRADQRDQAPIGRSISEVFESSKRPAKSRSVSSERESP